MHLQYTRINFLLYVVVYVLFFFTNTTLLANQLQTVSPILTDSTEIDSTEEEVILPSTIHIVNSTTCILNAYSYELYEDRGDLLSLGAIPVGGYLEVKPLSDLGRVYLENPLTEVETDEVYFFGGEYFLEAVTGCDTTGSALDTNLVNFTSSDLLEETNDNTLYEIFCDSISQIITEGNDDAEENLLNGGINLNSSDLELGQEANAQLVGLRFNNLAIPQGAFIENALIDFQVDEISTEVTNLQIWAENTSNASAFSLESFNLTNREKTESSIFWEPNAWDVVGARKTSPDLYPLIQEVVNREDWVSGNSIVLLISGSGKRTAESYNGTPQKVQLSISFCEQVDTCLDDDDDGICNENDCAPLDPQYPKEQGTPCNDFNEETLNDIIQSDGCTCKGVVPDECFDQSFAVATADDDAEETLSTGSVKLTSLDLELGENGQEQQLVGIRFNQIHIPQGAFVSSAFLKIPIDEQSNTTSSLTIWAEDNSNSTPFLATTENLSQRDKTSTSVTWHPDIWSVIGEVETSPDISSLIQEIINRPDWNSGAAISILIAGTGTRTAQSYNAIPYGIKLQYTYCNSLLEGPCEDDDNDGICNQDDCAPLDDSLPKAVGAPCNDYDSTTENDLIQEDGCSCVGTPKSICFDGSPLKIPGTSCTDANPTTQNDVIQADSCTCAGTLIELDATPIDPCLLTTIHTEEDKIIIDGLDAAAIVSLKILNHNWQLVDQCWDTNCLKPTETIYPGLGEFIVLIDYYTSSYEAVCTIIEHIKVGNISLVGNSDRKHTGVLNNSVQLYQDRTFEIYPNPADSYINIALTEYAGQNARIRLLNSLGQEVRQLEVKEIDASTIQMDISQIKMGLYYMQLLVNDVSINVKKVVVK